MRMAELHAVQDTISMLGHSGPPEPTPLERASEAKDALGKFLNDTPVISEAAHVVRAKQLVEHAQGAMVELEAERVALVDPLNKQVAAINSKFKAVHNTNPDKPGTLNKVLSELKARLTAYGLAEEAERAREALAAQLIAEQAEAAAREAEAAEQQAKHDAVIGVIDTGVADKIAAADQAFAEFESASRFAARAERGVNFRISDGGRTLAMRTEKTLVLDSYNKAIRAIGPNDKIRDAILSAARDYRKLHGSLPDGVSETSERKF